jgi:homoserine kinase
MPQHPSIADAANGISATAGLLLTLERGYLDELPEFLMQDRLHEPFRGPLCPGLDVLRALDVNGLLGVTVSGSGPSTLMWAEALKASEVAAVAREALAAAGVAAEVRVERVAPTGIRARWEGLEATRLSRTPG